MGQRCKTTGQFMRTRRPWGLSNFNDGYIDADGRMRVVVPKHPRADREGYVLRALVAYEAYHGCRVTPDFVVHHKNGNRLDDSKENLEKIEFGEHTRQHCQKMGLLSFCKQCGSGFYIPKWRVDQRKKHGAEIKFCSQICYKKAGGRWNEM